MRKISYILLSLLVFTACKDIAQEEDYTISLSEDKIIADYAGITNTITVYSKDGNWKILPASIPEWTTVEKVNGSDSNVEIAISPNNTFKNREATIKFISENNTCFLYISQEGIQNKSSLDWYTFPVNSFLDVKYDSENSNSSRNYRISANDVYVSSSIKDRIYHGGFIQKKVNGVSEAKGMMHYSYNPISISAFVNGKFYSRESIIPSPENTKELYDEIRANIPKQNGTFFYQTSPIQYNSYKHLHLLGIGNLGLKLDEIVAGKSYLENELENRTGLIYSYCNVLFNITMDLPSNLVKETIGDDDKKELYYINNIKYGRMAFLFLETDYDYNTSSIVISKVMKNLQLSDNEEKVKNSINASYIYFNEDHSVNIIRGFDVIRMFVTEVNDQPIIPLSFSINTYDRNSVGNFEFAFKIS